MNDATEAVLALLEPDEPPAVELVNGDGASNVVLVCDHAANRIPRKLGTLGLNSDQLADHIAWDPGAAELARRLSEILDAPLLLSAYSRLVIDCNRPLVSTESIAEQSADVPIPGNQKLSLEEKDNRIKTLFWPYHDAINRVLDSRALRANVLLSIHSFTPVLLGQARPWHIGISQGRNRQLAALLLEAFASNDDLIVGDNEPYPIEDEYDYTIPVHGDGRGLPCVMIEIRQDGIRTADDAALWAERIATAYRLIEPHMKAS